MLLKRLESSSESDVDGIGYAKKFIEENINLIEEDQYEELYDKGIAEYISDFTGETTTKTQVTKKNIGKVIEKMFAPNFSEIVRV